jgi:hypothetical protein
MEAGAAQVVQEGGDDQFAAGAGADRLFGGLGGVLEGGQVEVRLGQVVGLEPGADLGKRDRHFQPSR